MAQLKYKETQRMLHWDLMVIIGFLIISALFVTIQLQSSGSMSRNMVVWMVIGSLLVAGVVYYLNSIRMIAKYNEKSITLSMMPVGTVKRKIMWEDVVESEIVELPNTSKWPGWKTTRFMNPEKPVSKHSNTCLHLKLKNNEEINIGCCNPQELKEFVEHVKEIRPELEK